ncbi:MAG: hypothetical protein MJ108_10465 [Saccharofermentans sp.]|nr:hypothetical protein [Saccharofermentans sp.]
MKKNEFILLVITVILVIVIGIGFIRDDNKSLIDRTIGLEVTDDMRIDAMEKRGFLLYRSSYTAKIALSEEYDPQVLIDAFGATYEATGEYLSSDEFSQFKTQVLDNEKIVPNPVSGAYTYVLGVKDDKNNEVVYIIDLETGDKAYLYIYFYR